MKLYNFKLLTILFSSIALSRAGVVIISGDDSDDHCYTYSTTCSGFMGELFKETYLGSDVYGSVDILAIGVNSNKALSSFNNYVTGLQAETSTPALINVFHANTPALITEKMVPAYLINVNMIYLPSTSDSTLGGITDLEINAFITKNLELANYVNVLGGSLLVLNQRPTKYGWIPFPITVTTYCREYMTPTGYLTSFAPGFTDSNVDHYCWHNWFYESNFGSNLDCLVRDQLNNNCYMFGGRNAIISAEDCTDGIDNDGDADIDCADSDCTNHVSCGITSYELYTSSNTTFVNNNQVLTEIDGMTLSSEITGVYKVDFNCQFDTQLVSITEQAVTDLNQLIAELSALSDTDTFPLFTASEIITPGVYSTAGAATIATNVNLNGLVSDYFVFNIDGALTVGAAVTISLTGGVLPDNVFFVSNGAIAIAAGATVTGTLISKIGAVAIGVGAYLDGRILSGLGALSAGGPIVVPSCDCSIFDLGILSNFAMYTIGGAVSTAAANIITGDVGNNIGAITGFETATHTGTVYTVTPTFTPTLTLFYICINGIIVPNTERQYTNMLVKDDVFLSNFITLTSTDVVSICVINAIGFSQFYNRVFSIRRI
jgi:hypothetical protein